MRPKNLDMKSWMSSISELSNSAEKSIWSKLQAYLDELRNLGYEPLEERDKKRAKSFFHMMNWLKKNPDKLKYAKTGWPRLFRYRLFKKKHHFRSRNDRK